MIYDMMHLCMLFDFVCFNNICIYLCLYLLIVLCSLDLVAMLPYCPKLQTLQIKKVCL
jgi:hypothetical protein